MAKLTKEQYLEKIDSLNEKYERIESRYIKKLDKIKKEYDKNLSRVPYEQECVGGTRKITREDLDRHYQFDLKHTEEEYKDSMNRNRWSIMNAREQLDKIVIKEQKLASYKELSTPIPELVNEIKKIVEGWVESEKSIPENRRYYSKLDEKGLMNFVILPLAENITYRCSVTIGKMKSFSEIKFIYGEVDVFTYNENGSSCHLYATIVSRHSRTNSYGTTFDVRPHIRTLTK